MMTKDEALKMAIEDAMKFVVTLNNYEDAIQSKVFKSEADRYLSYASVVIKSLATSLKEALEQPAQEPVAWMSAGRILTDNKDQADWWIEAGGIATPLYTHPAQPLTRDWIGTALERADKDEAFRKGLINELAQPLSDDEYMGFS